MSRLYGEAHRALQRQFDSERLADRIEQRLCRTAFNDEDWAFIVDPQTIVFPSYDGNGMFLTAGNISATASVGMLFIDFATPKRLRINGTAKLESTGFISSPYPEAQFTIVVQVEEAFPNCPRYVHRRDLMEPSRFVPRPGIETPIPAWKQMDWAQDVLPAGDPATPRPR